MQTDKTGNNNYFYDLKEKDKVVKGNSDLKSEFKSLLSNMSFKSEGMDVNNILKSHSRIETDFTKVNVREEKSFDMERSEVKKPSFESKKSEASQEQVAENNKVENKKETKSKEQPKTKEVGKEEKDSYIAVEDNKNLGEKSEKVSENCDFTDDVEFAPNDNESEEVKEDIVIMPFNQMVENVDMAKPKSSEKEAEFKEISTEDKDFEVSLKDAQKTELDFISKEVVNQEDGDSQGENFTHFINSLVKKDFKTTENKSDLSKTNGLEEIQQSSNDNFDLINFEEVKKETKKQPLDNDFSKVKEQMNKISSVIGGNEAVSVDVAKEVKKQEKVGLNSFNSVPLMTANDDGEFEMVLNQAQMSNNANENNFNQDLTSFDEKTSKNVETVDGEANFSFNLSPQISTAETSISNVASSTGVKVEGSLKIDGINNVNAQIKNVDLKNMKTEVKEANGKIEVKASEIANQIKVKVQNLKQGEDKITIKLKPYELGDIEIKLNISKDGKVSAVINSNKQETMQIMQKDVEALQKMFNDNGYKADVSSFSFNFKGSNSQGQDGNNHQNNGSQNYASSNLSNDDAYVKEDSLPSYQGRGILA
ncbi:MAG: Flagellar hook-length control protein FliK [Alphaproteobacteria bacterium ADurb.Bin438]|nr:MAG: Flagellar hook-length control protein FliK [Alphaproteobacteria bacterium ADurb.Bin438]